MAMEPKFNSIRQHLDADTDSGITAIHHTLGPGTFQASPGSHRHDGTDSHRISWNNVVDQPLGSYLQVAYMRNDTAADIPKGKVVYPNGSNGTHKLIALAQANAEAPSSRTFGVTYEPIAKNTSGLVVTFGELLELNTSGLTEGASIWLSPTVPGGITTTKPSSPDHLVHLGFCIYSHNNHGKIFVRVTNGFEVEELHNVKLTNLQNNDALRYDAASGLWVNRP